MMETKMKVLIIDDSKAIHILVEDMLVPKGIQVIHVYNGQEAIDKVNESGFDASLILLDWEMPLLSGIDALPQLRAICPHIPILMVTSKNTMADIATAIELGAADYVIKPYTQDIIIGKIASILGMNL